MTWKIKAIGWSETPTYSFKCHPGILLYKISGILPYLHYTPCWADPASSAE